MRTAQHMCSEDRSSHGAAEATPPRPALGPGAGRGRGMWRHWGWLTPALLHSMSDLERRRTRCSSVLRSPHLSSGERTRPQPAWLGTGGLRSGGVQRWLHVIVWEVALKKSCYHFLQLWTGWGGGSTRGRRRGLLEDLYYYEPEPLLT